MSEWKACPSFIDPVVLEVLQRVAAEKGVDSAALVEVYKRKTAERHLALLNTLAEEWAQKIVMRVQACFVS